VSGAAHKSPSPTGVSTSSRPRQNVPVRITENYVLAHRSTPGVNQLIQQQHQRDLMDGKHKEVDEWLMGSGESAETAISRGLKNQPSFRIIDQKANIVDSKIKNNQ
jgi:hypothetical protein